MVMIKEKGTATEASSAPIEQDKQFIKNTKLDNVDELRRNFAKEYTGEHTELDLNKVHDDMIRNGKPIDLTPSFELNVTDKMKADFAAVVKENLGDLDRMTDQDPDRTYVLPEERVKEMKGEMIQALGLEGKVTPEEMRIGVLEADDLKSANIIVTIKGQSFDMGRFDGEFTPAGPSHPTSQIDLTAKTTGQGMDENAPLDNLDAVRDMFKKGPSTIHNDMWITDKMPDSTKLGVPGLDPAVETAIVTFAQKNRGDLEQLSSGTLSKEREVELKEELIEVLGKENEVKPGDMEIGLIKPIAAVPQAAYLSVTIRGEKETYGPI